MALIMYLKSTLGIETQILCSSRIEAEGNKLQRLINICRKYGATEYLTGDAAKAYLDVKLFEDNGVRVRYHHYKHPKYPQLFGSFVPHLSVVDLLFNCGSESLDYLMQRKGMV